MPGLSGMGVRSRNENNTLKTREKEYNSLEACKGMRTADVGKNLQGREY